MNASPPAPKRAGLVLAALVPVAAVANLNLAVANVALPSIGAAFDAGQTALNLVAVGYSLGLASSVLYLGALGDRHWRKMMLVRGRPTCARARFDEAFKWSLGKELWMVRLADWAPEARRCQSAPVVHERYARPLVFR